MNSIGRGKVTDPETGCRSSHYLQAPVRSICLVSAPDRFTDLSCLIFFQDTLFNVYVNCSVNVETSGCPSGLRSDAAQDFIDSYLRTGNKGLQIYQGLTTTNTDLNLLANVVEYTDCKKIKHSVQGFPPLKKCPLPSYLVPLS